VSDRGGLIDKPSSQSRPNDKISFLKLLRAQKSYFDLQNNQIIPFYSNTNASKMGCLALKIAHFFF